MVTRAKAGIVQPRIHPSLLVHTEPKSVKQALQDTKWFAAMTDEFQALQKNNTWDPSLSSSSQKCCWM